MDENEFLAEREESMRERQRIDALVEKYKNQFPNINACWDTSIQSIGHNNIREDIVLGGMAIFDCDMNTLWNGLYDPSIYAGSTIWSKEHDSDKIARVIENWEKSVPLSPIFLVNHETYRKGLVADGKHRLTVSHAISATDMPFMVSVKDVAWAKKCFPSATIICTTGP
jgi:hypothetical protein